VPGHGDVRDLQPPSAPAALRVDAAGSQLSCSISSLSSPSPSIPCLESWVASAAVRGAEHGRDGHICLCRRSFALHHATNACKKLPPDFVVSSFAGAVTPLPLWIGVLLVWKFVAIDFATTEAIAGANGATIFHFWEEE